MVGGPPPLQTPTPPFLWASIPTYWQYLVTQWEFEKKNKCSDNLDSRLKLHKGVFEEETTNTLRLHGQHIGRKFAAHDGGPHPCLLSLLPFGPLPRPPGNIW